jgi:hypothetical protein
MWLGDVGTGASAVGKQYVSISLWQPSTYSSSLIPCAQSSSVNQQYWVRSAMREESVSFQVAFLVTVGVGFRVGVYQLVVKFGGLSTAVAGIQDEKKDDDRVGRGG